MMMNDLTDGETRKIKELDRLERRSPYVKTRPRVSTALCCILPWPNGASQYEPTCWHTSHLSGKHESPWMNFLRPSQMRWRAEKVIEMTRMGFITSVCKQRSKPTTHRQGFRSTGSFPGCSSMYYVGRTDGAFHALFMGPVFPFLALCMKSAGNATYSHQQHVSAGIHECLAELPILRKHPPPRTWSAAEVNSFTTVCSGTYIAFSTWPQSEDATW